MSELYQFRDGRELADEQASEKLFMIRDRHPEKPSRDDTGYSWDETGLAQLFGEIYRYDTRYCIEHKSWYTYFNGKWNKDEGSVLVSEKIKEFKTLMILYCGEIQDSDLQDRYFKFIGKLGDRRFRDRLLKDCMGTCLIHASEFDNKPNLINCLNGTFNLETFEINPPDPNDLLTHQTNFKYNINAKSKRWNKFISEVMEGNEDKADYLQRALGYSLLGTAKEECMFILYGKTTRNGKSTLLNAIEHLLGDYADVADTGLISKTKNTDPGAANPSLAKLKGKRFVTMSESNKYGALDEAAIKQMTGGEPISARALYQTPITFTPQFKLWLSCNDLPDVRDRSLFASERLRVIEFNKHFSQAEQDKTLKEEFSTQDSMAAIFNWMVGGYNKYLARGLHINDELKQVDRDYEVSTDTVLQFLQERCELDADYQIKAKDLYEKYKSWCRNYGLREMSAKWFNAEMLSHVEWYKDTGIKDGYKTYKGLKIKEVI